MALNVNWTDPTPDDVAVNQRSCGSRDADRRRTFRSCCPRSSTVASAPAIADERVPPRDAWRVEEELEVGVAAQHVVALAQPCPAFRPDEPEAGLLPGMVASFAIVALVPPETHSRIGGPCGRIAG